MYFLLCKRDYNPSSGPCNVCKTVWNTSCTSFHFLSCDCHMILQSRVHQCKDGGRRKGAWSEIKALKQELRKREEVQYIHLLATTQLHVHMYACLLPLSCMCVRTLAYYH